MDRLGIGRLVVSNCVIHHLFFPSVVGVLFGSSFFFFFPISYLTVFISTHSFSNFCPSDSLPRFQPGVCVNKQSCSAGLLAGVKPQHSSICWELSGGLLWPLQARGKLLCCALYL